MYEHGAFVGQDIDFAIHFFKKGLSTKYLEIGYELAHISLHDQAHQNIKEALNIFEKPMKIIEEMRIYLTKFKDLYYINNNGINVKADDEKAQKQINH